MQALCTLCKEISLGKPAERKTHQKKLSAYLHHICFGELIFQFLRFGPLQLTQKSSNGRILGKILNERSLSWCGSLSSCPLTKEANEATFLLRWTNGKQGKESAYSFIVFEKGPSEALLLKVKQNILNSSSLLNVLYSPPLPCCLLFAVKRGRKKDQVIKFWDLQLGTYFTPNWAINFFTNCKIGGTEQSTKVHP